MKNESYFEWLQQHYFRTRFFLILPDFYFGSSSFFLDDGNVRVWRNYCDDENGRLNLVTAFSALSGMIPSHRGTFHLVSFLTGGVL